MIKFFIGVLFLFGSAASQDCGTHSNGEMFEASECSPYYYLCDNGIEKRMNCSSGTVFDSSLKLCNHRDQVGACASVTIVGCKDENGDPVDGFSYTQSADCNSGTYYTCENGVETEKTCGVDQIYDPSIRNCNWDANVEDCTTTSIDTVHSSTEPDKSPPPTTSTVATKTDGGLSTESGKNPTTTTSTIAANTDGGLSTEPAKEPTTTTTSTIGMKTDDGLSTEAAKEPTTTTSTIATNTDGCGTHNNGDTYEASECSPHYYQCVHGDEIEMQCISGTVFNPAKHECDYRDNIEACSSVTIDDCKDENGDPVDGYSYTMSSDCNNGTYYTCKNGIVTQQSCDEGQIYDPDLRICNWAFNVEDCKNTSLDYGVSTLKPDEEPPSTTTTTTTTTTTNAHELYTTDPWETKSSYVTEDDSDLVPTTSEPDASTATPSLNPTTKWHGFSTVEPAESTSTTKSSYDKTDWPEGGSTTEPEIVASTTTTQAHVDGKTYVGFVVDDTGSMSNEIIAVKHWISDCVSGVNPDCGQVPTGGWIMTSFNDPTVGLVIGPTMDANDIIAEVDSYYAHGGGDCPEMGYSGLHNAAEVVPDENGGCKVYFFTDATGKDYIIHDTVVQQYKEKGCKFIPILTGCCGECPEVCESVDPQYCIDHVTDYHSSDSAKRKKRASGDSIQTLFYKLSEETGGNIYVTEKPSSPDDLLDFLEEEVTLGFCTSSELAGPSPDGYKCEADCVAMNQCWDRSVSTCYCNTTCTHDPIPSGYSQCAGEQVIECDPSVPLEIIPDQKNCTAYYMCYSGNMAHMTCAKGTVYSQDSTSYCDHPWNVPPPCGTKGS